METTAHENLRRLAAAVEGRRPLPEGVTAWLAAGLREYIDSGGRSSLDRCLGLRGGGVRSLETVDAYRRRNAALMAAMEFTHNGTHSPARDRANELADAVRRFRQRKWPRIRHLDEPPENLNELERRLFRAFRVGLQVPESDKQIRACVLPPPDGSRK